SEFGQPSEWSEERGLDWWILDQPVHQGLHRLVRQLNRVYREHPASRERDNDGSGLEWITSDPGNNVLAFGRRWAAGAPVACVVNCGGNPVGPYRLGLPAAGVWREVLNTDAEEFSGSGVGNHGTVTAVPEPFEGHPA